MTANGSDVDLSKNLSPAANPGFQCQFCQKQYVNQMEFAQHTIYEHSSGNANNNGNNSGSGGMKAQLEDSASASEASTFNLFKCKLCRKYYTNGREFEGDGHTPSKSSSKVSKGLPSDDSDDVVYKCETCQKYFATKIEYARHGKDEHDTQFPGTHNICPKALAGSSASSESSDIDDGGSEGPSTSSDSSESDPEDAETTAKDTDSSPPPSAKIARRGPTDAVAFKCKSCEKHFTNKALYAQHKETEHGDLLAPTSYSDSGFFFVASERSSDAVAFKCKFCQKYFTNKLLFAQHKETEHGVPFDPADYIDSKPLPRN